MSDKADFINAAIREKRERDNPQPLTPDELREMDGEPVWLNIADGKWGLVNSDDDEIELSRCGFIEFEKVIGLAYRYKPKEEHHEAN